jgi:hypothetical protein
VAILEMPNCTCLIKRSDDRHRGWIRARRDPTVSHLTGAGHPSSSGMSLLSTCDVGGHEDTLQIMLWLGHAFVAHPFSGGFSVVDVRDPRQPKTVAYVPALPGSRTLHLQLHEGILLLTSEADMSSTAKYKDKAQYFGSQLGYQTSNEDELMGGLRIFDVSTPANPIEIRFMRIPGFGVHRLFWTGGPRAVASEMPIGSSDFIMTVLDMTDPTDPALVGRWAPSMLDDPSSPVGRFGLHHAILAGSLGYGAWRAGGLQIVDISGDEPALVGDLLPTAWGGGNTHTTLPLPGRGLVVVADESVQDAGADGLRRIWLCDVSDPSVPAMLGALPEPAEQDFRTAGGVFGPHNLHENRPDSWQSEEIIFATYQNAGVRAYDISEPAAVAEVGHLVPPPPARIRDPRTPNGPLVAQTADLFVTRDGLIISSDLNAGLSFVQFEGAA